MVKATAMENKDHNSKLLSTPKEGFIQKKKNNKFKQTPMGKVALINGSKPLNNNETNKQQLGKQRNLTSQKLSVKNKEQKKENSLKTNKKDAKKSKANQSLSDEDINERVALKKQELMEETDDSESEEESNDDDDEHAKNVPNILGTSLADDTDEDDEEFEVDNAKLIDVNKGVKMFKGVKSNKKANDSLKSSDKSSAESSVLDTDEDDDDDDSEDVEEEEDDDVEEEEDDDEDVEEEEESDEEEESENEASESALGIKALLGASIADDDDDDEDFVEPDGNEEDDDISDEDEEEEGDNSILDNSQKSNNSKTDQDSSFEDSRANDQTIFVGNLPKEVTQKQLQKLFKKFGQIESVRIRGIVAKSLNIPKRVAAITKNLHPKLKSVYAYIKFVSEESAKAALSMNGTKFEGNTIRVDTATRSEKKYDPKKSIYLGNLPFKIDENTIRKHFEGCGEIESVRVVKDNLTGIAKGFGYVNFTSEDAVALAFELNGTTILNRSIIVKPYVEQQSPKQRKRSHSAGSDERSSARKHLKDSAGKASPIRNKHSVKKGGKEHKFQKKQVSPQQTKTFQGQKADKTKKKKESKFDKKKKILAQKLTAKPKKPTN